MGFGVFILSESTNIVSLTPCLTNVGHREGGGLYFMITEKSSKILMDSDYCNIS